MDVRILKRRRIMTTLVGVTLLGVMSCAACATAPKPEPNEHLYRMGGFMVWPCSQERPKVFLSREAHTSPEWLRAIVAHEESHVAVAESFGSCEAYQKWRKDDTNKVLLEALAFCAMIRQQVRDGADGDAMLIAAGRSLAGYGYGVTEQQARQRILAVCR